MLANTLTSSGRRRFVEAQTVVSQINAEKKPRKIPSKNNSDTTDIKSRSLFGSDILSLTPDSPYNVHFPMKRGQLDLSPGKVGGKTSHEYQNVFGFYPGFYSTLNPQLTGWLLQKKKNF